MFKLIVVGLLPGLRLVAYLFSFLRTIVLNEASWSIKSLPIIALPDAVDNVEGFYYLPSRGSATRIGSQGQSA
jgi:hypothetical protein